MGACRRKYLALACAPYARGELSPGALVLLPLYYAGRRYTIRPVCEEEILGVFSLLGFKGQKVYEY